jgi:DNA end-binding protein Ku
MAARPVASGTISFGLVSIPVKLYTAASSQSISFNLLHAKCGNRIRQQRFCPVCNEVVERDELVRGYEFAKDQYVRFKEEELEALEGEDSQAIEISEFVPLSTVDPIYYEKGYYLGPDKGGEKPYRLLTDAMNKAGKVALAKFVMRGKENLVLVRPAMNGLMLHAMYYADEVRNFDDIAKGESAKISDAETNLAIRLIDELSSDAFHPEQFQDEYRQRVLDLVEQKAQGKQITVAKPQAPRAQVIDLMSALKESLGKQPAKEKKRAARAETADAEKPQKRARSAKR